MRITKQELFKLAESADLFIHYEYNYYVIELPAKNEEKKKQGLIERRLFSGSLKECYIYLNGYIDGLDK